MQLNDFIYLPLHAGKWIESSLFFCQSVFPANVPAVPRQTGPKIMDWSANPGEKWSKRWALEGKMIINSTKLATESIKGRWGGPEDSHIPIMWPSAKSNKFTLLLLHGFPDWALMWERFIVDRLRTGENKIVAPDLHGDAGTLRRSDAKAFHHRAMQAEQTSS